MCGYYDCGLPSSQLCDRMALFGFVMPENGHHLHKACWNVKSDGKCGRQQFSARYDSFN